jgi:hypothetical protein
MLFLINEQYLTTNGTVMSRKYAHQETFAEMKDVQSIGDFPLMNGSQFIAWYVSQGGGWVLIIVPGAPTWSAVDVR